MFLITGRTLKKISIIFFILSLTSCGFTKKKNKMDAGQGPSCTGPDPTNANLTMCYESANKENFERLCQLFAGRTASSSPCDTTKYKIKCVQGQGNDRYTYYYQNGTGVSCTGVTTIKSNSLH